MVPASMALPSTVFLKVFVGNYEKEIMSQGAPYTILLSVIFIFSK